MTAFKDYTSCLKYDKWRQLFFKTSFLQSYNKRVKVYSKVCSGLDPDIFRHSLDAAARTSLAISASAWKGPLKNIGLMHVEAQVAAEASAPAEEILCGGWWAV